MQTIKAGEDVEKREPSYLGGMQIDTATVEKEYADYLKLRTELPYNPAIHSWVYTWENHSSWRYMHLNAHCSTI